MDSVRRAGLWVCRWVIVPAAAGVAVLIDWRAPGELPLDEPSLAQPAGLAYVNLGFPNDMRPVRPS